MHARGGHSSSTQRAPCTCNSWGPWQLLACCHVATVLCATTVHSCTHLGCQHPLLPSSSVLTPALLPTLCSGCSTLSLFVQCDHRPCVSLYGCKQRHGARMQVGTPLDQLWCEPESCRWRHPRATTLRVPEGAAALLSASVWLSTCARHSQGARDESICDGNWVAAGTVIEATRIPASPRPVASARRPTAALTPSLALLLAATSLRARGAGRP